MFEKQMWSELSGLQAGAALGGMGGGGRTPPPQGFDPLPTQRVPL